jgi:hypothetical protein
VIIVVVVVVVREEIIYILQNYIFGNKEAWNYGAFSVNRLSSIMKPSLPTIC